MYFGFIWYFCSVLAILGSVNNKLLIRVYIDMAFGPIGSKFRV